MWVVVKPKIPGIAFLKCIAQYHKKFYRKKIAHRTYIYLIEVEDTNNIDICNYYGLGICETLLTIKGKIELHGDWKEVRIIKKKYIREDLGYEIEGEVIVVEDKEIPIAPQLMRKNYKPKN